MTAVARQKAKKEYAGLPPIQHAVGAAAIRLKQDKTNSRLTKGHQSDAARLVSVRERDN
jgi:hypothetical protein